MSVPDDVREAIIDGLVKSATEARDAINEIRGIKVDVPVSRAIFQKDADFILSALEAAGFEVTKAGTIPRDLAELVVHIGKAEWGSTPEHDADGHAAHVRESVLITAKHFGQTEPQKMHGLYIDGTETVICHTGTSPNSPQIARALTGAWNYLHEKCAAMLTASRHKEKQDG